MRRRRDVCQRVNGLLRMPEAIANRARLFWASVVSGAACLLGGVCLNLCISPMWEARAYEEAVRQAQSRALFSELLVASFDVLRLVLPFFLSFVPALILFNLLYPTTDRDPFTRCERCGYILKGLPEPRCPECGTQI